MAEERVNLLSCPIPDAAILSGATAGSSCCCPGCWDMHHEEFAFTVPDPLFPG